jgi:hypothetical protein
VPDGGKRSSNSVTIESANASTCLLENQLSMRRGL